MNNSPFFYSKLEDIDLCLLFGNPDFFKKKILLKNHLYSKLHTQFSFIIITLHAFMHSMKQFDINIFFITHHIFITFFFIINNDKSITQITINYTLYTISLYSIRHNNDHSSILYLGRRTLLVLNSLLLEHSHFFFFL